MGNNRTASNDDELRSNIANNLTTSCMNWGTYYHFHNILRLFDVLPNFPFTTSKTKRDY